MEQTTKYCVDVPEMGKLLGISRASAYELANTEGFPIVRVGKRMLVPMDALKRWVNEQAGQDRNEK